MTEPMTIPKIATSFELNVMAPRARLLLTLLDEWEHGYNPEYLQGGHLIGAIHLLQLVLRHYADMPNAPKPDGLFDKYRVFNRQTGTEVDRAFVLRPASDPAAWRALRVYADLVRGRLPELADGLTRWLDDLPTSRDRIADIRARREEVKLLDAEIDRLTKIAAADPLADPMELEQALNQVKLLERDLRDDLDYLLTQLADGKDAE